MQALHNQVWKTSSTSLLFFPPWEEGELGTSMLQLSSTMSKSINFVPNQLCTVQQLLHITDKDAQGIVKWLQVEEIKVAENESKATNTIIKVLFWAIKKGDMNINNNEKLRIPLTLHVLIQKTLLIHLTERSSDLGCKRHFQTVSFMQS